MFQSSNSPRFQLLLARSGASEAGIGHSNGLAGITA
jgi:hypothetical protein